MVSPMDLPHSRPAVLSGYVDVHDGRAEPKALSFSHQQHTVCHHYRATEARESSINKKKQKKNTTTVTRLLTINLSAQRLLASTVGMAMPRQRHSLASVKPRVKQEKSLADKLRRWSRNCSLSSSVSRKA